VITALTAQNTIGVRAIAEVEPGFVAAQIDAVAEDFSLAAAKTGMLARKAIIEIVADRVRTHKISSLVVDPVMVAASGDVLLVPDAIAAMRELMLPLAFVVTPNMREAELLTGIKVTNLTEMHEAARRLVELGARAALVKGGRLTDGEDAVDMLYDGLTTREYRERRVAIARAHGAGCTLSAAITASLARGLELVEAVKVAKRYVTRALESAPRIGRGARPLNHLVQSDPVDP
jgi:hydroxymethylpyrimidine/phosphomethylpyrimidine kinase